jgi:hypothetical protein
MKKGKFIILAGGIICLLAGCYSDEKGRGDVSVVLSDAEINATFCSDSFMGTRTGLTITNNHDRPIDLLRVVIEAPEDPSTGRHLTEGDLLVEAGLVVQPGSTVTLDCGNGVTFEDYYHLFGDEAWYVEFSATATLVFKIQGETSERRSSADATIHIDKAFDNCGILLVPSHDCRM